VFMKLDGIVCIYIIIINGIGNMLFLFLPLCLYFLPSYRTGFYLSLALPPHLLCTWKLALNGQDPTDLCDLGHGQNRGFHQRHFSLRFGLLLPNIINPSEASTFDRLLVSSMSGCPKKDGRSNAPFPIQILSVFMFSLDGHLTGSGPYSDGNKIYA